MNMQEFFKKLTQFITIPRFLITLGLTVFLSVNIFGLVLSSSKQLHLNILGCASSQQSNGCKSVSQHVSNWQSTFSAIEAEPILLFFMLLLGTVLYVSSSTKALFNLNDIDSVGSGSRNLRRRFQSFLLFAFSKGIIQPTR